MKKIVAACAFSMILASGAYAAENSKEAESVNAVPFSQMDEHEKAAVFHESLDNGHDSAHQAQAERHRKMSGQQGNKAGNSQP